MFFPGLTKAQSWHMLDRFDCGKEEATCTICCSS